MCRGEGKRCWAHLHLHGESQPQHLCHLADVEDENLVNWCIWRFFGRMRVGGSAAVCQTLRSAMLISGHVKQRLRLRADWAQVLLSAKRWSFPVQSHGRRVISKNIYEWHRSDLKLHSNVRSVGNPALMFRSDSPNISSG